MEAQVESRNFDNRVFEGVRQRPGVLPPLVSLLQVIREWS
jgi:hypothetical protein